MGALSIHRSSPSRSGRGKVKQTKWMKGHEGGGGGGVCMGGGDKESVTLGLKIQSIRCTRWR